MSKFLALGLSLGEVVRAATVNPAGPWVRPWRPADRSRRSGDLAVFEFEVGDLLLDDTYGSAPGGTVLLVNRATIAGAPCSLRSTRRDRNGGSR